MIVIAGNLPPELPGLTPAAYRSRPPAPAYAVPLVRPSPGVDHGQNFPGKKRHGLLGHVERDAAEPE